MKTTILMCLVTAFTSTAFATEIKCVSANRKYDVVLTSTSASSWFGNYAVSGNMNTADVIVEKNLSTKSNLAVSLEVDGQTDKIVILANTDKTGVLKGKMLVAKVVQDTTCTKK
jgi:hypothetical protein